MRKRLGRSRSIDLQAEFLLLRLTIARVLSGPVRIAIRLSCFESRVAVSFEGDEERDDDSEDGDDLPSATDEPAARKDEDAHWRFLFVGASGSAGVTTTCCAMFVSDDPDTAAFFTPPSTISFVTAGATHPAM